MVAAPPRSVSPGVTLHEPATFLTDVLLAILGFTLAARIRKRAGLEHPVRLWWHRALSTMALGAFLGGLYHGFAPNFPAWVDAAWWRLVLANLCLIGLTMSMSLIHELGLSGFWGRFAALKCIAALAAVTFVPEFWIAILDYGFAMLLWLVAAVCVRRRWSLQMAAAVMLSGVAAWVQQAGVGLSPHFNHNDLFHLIQAFALFGFFQAGVRLQGHRL